MKKWSIVDFINLGNEDSRQVLSWRNDPSIKMHMFSQHDISFEEHEAFIRHLKKDNSSKYWMVENLGVITLKRIDFNNLNAFLGIYRNPLNKSRGVAKALMQILLDKSFNELKLHTLKLEVFSDNLRAIKFYTKCGFSWEGLLREHFLRSDGIFVDLMIMGMIDSEYKKLAILK